MHQSSTKPNRTKPPKNLASLSRNSLTFHTLMAVAATKSKGNTSPTVGKSTQLRFGKNSQGKRKSEHQRNVAKTNQYNDVPQFDLHVDTLKNLLRSYTLRRSDNGQSCEHCSSRPLVREARLNCLAHTRPTIQRTSESRSKPATSCNLVSIVFNSSGLLSARLVDSLGSVEMLKSSSLRRSPSPRTMSFSISK